MVVRQGRRRRRHRRRTRWGTLRMPSRRERSRRPFSAVCKNTKALIPHKSGTKARRTSWYHPVSAPNNSTMFRALHSARHVGKAESTIQRSWIQAQRRVRQRPGWFAPSTSSLKSRRFAYYSSSQPHTLFILHAFRHRYSLRFRLRGRHFGFSRSLLSHRLRNQPEHALNRSHQRIAGKNHE